MVSSSDYELPPYQQEYLASSTSPRAVSTLHSPLVQDQVHNISDCDIDTETLLNNRTMWDRFKVGLMPRKEQTAVQCDEIQPKHSRRIHIHDWYWEIAAAVFSFVCVIAVIIILRIYQGKPLSSWRFYHDITLNTVVALLSTLSRTALIVPVASCISQLKWIHLTSSPRPLQDFQILDEASRGPGGSLNLIWRLNFKTKLATWGASITIVSVAMGPLSQQLLSYPSRLHFENSGATFYKSQIYDSGMGWGFTEVTYRWMDPKMQGAILNGLYNLSAPVQVQCQTGNCQWDDFTTLAVASECKNVTSNTVETCEETSDAYICNYTTPSGFVVASMIDSSPENNGKVTTFNSTARPPPEPTAGEVPSTLLEFASVKMRDLEFNTDPDVTECRVRWVARHVQNTTVVNGTFNSGVATDYELVGVQNPFDRDVWNTFNVSDESAAKFPGNISFSIVFTDNVRITRFLSTVFSSTLDDVFGLALNNATDLTQTMERISESITYSLGQSPSGIEVLGETITNEQYIFVNWEWIILPIAEVVMAIAFLGATLLQSWRKGVVAWKSSAIIPLLTEMKDSWKNGDSGIESAREVRERVKTMTGLIESKEGGGQVFRRLG